MVTDGLEELGRSARDSRVLSDLVRVAEWVGDGRAVTSAGKPLPDELPGLAAVLDVEVTSRRKRRGVRDASDLMAIWERAKALQFVEMADRRVVQGAAYLALQDSANDSVALEVWKGCFAFLAAPEAPEALSDLDPAALIATLVIHILAGHEGPVPVVHLATDVHGALAAEFGDLPDVPAMLSQPKREVVSGALVLLGQLGAVRVGGKGVELTALGEWLVEELSADPVEMIDVDADPPTLLRLVAEHEPPGAIEMAMEWVEARDSRDVVSDLLTTAVGVGPLERQAAFLLIHAFGLEAEDAWRQAADLPTVGPYARAHLFDAGEGKPPEQTDLEWITVDTCAAALLHTPDPAEAAASAPALFQAVQGLRPARIDALGHPHGHLVKSILPSTRPGAAVAFPAVRQRIRHRSV